MLAVAYEVDDDGPERGQLALFTPVAPIGCQLSLFPEMVPPAQIYPELSPAEWLEACRELLDAARARSAGQLAMDVGA